MQWSWSGNPVFYKGSEFHPCQASPLASAQQNFIPDMEDAFPEQEQPPCVIRHSEVLVITLYHTFEPVPDFINIMMHMRLKVLTNASQGFPHSLSVCLSKNLETFMSPVH